MDYIAALLLVTASHWSGQIYSFKSMVDCERALPSIQNYFEGSGLKQVKARCYLIRQSDAQVD